MSARDVWLATERCITTYRALPPSSCTTEDEHIDSIVGPLLRSNHLDGDDASFVKEVTLGVFRYGPFLAETIAAYCAAKHRNKADAVALEMLAYLLIHRFDELGPDVFRHIVNRCTHYPRLAEFMGLLLNRKDLDAYFVPRWRQVTDDGYVEHICQKLLSHAKNGASMVHAYFLERATGATTTESDVTEGVLPSITSGKGRPPADGSSPPRQPPKFKLFKWQQRDYDAEVNGTAKPKSTLPPHEIRELMAVKPRETYAPVIDRCTDAERACVEAAKTGKKVSTLAEDARRANRIKERTIPFVRFRAAEAPVVDYDEVRRHEEAARLRMMEDEVEQEKQRRLSPRQVQQSMHGVMKAVPVKHTFSAIQREELLYRREEEAERQRILKKTQELRDDSEYVAWRQQQEAIEKQERELLIAKRKLEMTLADQMARETKDKQRVKNQKATREQKKLIEEHREATAELEAEKVEEARRKITQLRRELTDDREEAIQRANEAKLAIARDVRDESHRLEIAVAVQLDLERERKQEIIRQIKETHAKFVALHREQRERQASFTATELGQLETMTWPQLKEKLAEVNAQHKELEERRRAQIATQKEARQKQIAEAEAKILECRATRRVTKQQARDELVAEIDAKTKKALAEEERRLFELQALLQEKRDKQRAEKQQRIAEERQAQLAARLLSSDATAVTQAKWREMERGAKNSLTREQNEALTARSREKALQGNLQSIREHLIDNHYETRRAMAEESESIFAEATRRHTENQRFDDEVRKSALAQSKAMRNATRMGRSGTA